MKIALIGSVSMPQKTILVLVSWTCILSVGNAERQTPLMVIQRTILGVNSLNYFQDQSFFFFSMDCEQLWRLDCLTLHLSDYLDKDFDVISDISLTFNSQWNVMVKGLCWKSKKEILYKKWSSLPPLHPAPKRAVNSTNSRSIWKIWREL